MPNIQYQELEHCKFKVHYVADADKVSEKCNEIIKGIKDSKVKIPGFRPGKATTDGIKIHCKKFIDTQLTKEMCAMAYDDIVFETKWKPIGYPQVINPQLAGSSFSTELVFLKKPEFKLQEYKGFKIPKPHQQMSVSDLAEKMLQDMRVSCGDVVPYDENDFVQDKDQVTLDVKCTIKDEIFEPFTSNGLLYDVGSNLIPDFDSKLIGMKAGEERDFDIIFVDHPSEHLKDKRAKFYTKVHMGTKHYPCPLDDTLAEKAGFKTFLELRNHTLGEASRQLQMMALHQVNQQVIQRLVNNHEFEVPSWLLLMESQHLVQQHGMKWENLKDEEKEIINEKSKAGIKLSLILDSIRENEPESVVPDEVLVKHIKIHAQSMGKNPDEFITNSQKDGSIMGMLTSLRDEVTIQWIVTQCEIVE